MESRTDGYHYDREINEKTAILIAQIYGGTRIILEDEGMTKIWEELVEYLLKSDG